MSKKYGKIKTMKLIQTMIMFTKMLIMTPMFLPTRLLENQINQVIGQIGVLKEQVILETTKETIKEITKSMIGK
jgi:CheY-specific phosphatase CheX